MKKSFLIVLLVLPMAGNASFGWRFSDFSLLAGQQYRREQQPLTAFEWQYDHFMHSCLKHHHYRGVGINYAFNENYRELGLKGMYNPSFMPMVRTRSTTFYPYLFGQGNLMQVSNTTDKAMQLKNGIGFRPGVGVTGNFREDKAISIRAYLQLGYNLLMNQILPIKNAITLEFKVGIGIDGRLVMSN